MTKQGLGLRPGIIVFAVHCLWCQRARCSTCVLAVFLPILDLVQYCTIEHDGTVDIDGCSLEHNVRNRVLRVHSNHVCHAASTWKVMFVPKLHLQTNDCQPRTARVWLGLLFFFPDIALYRPQIPRIQEEHPDASAGRVQDFFLKSRSISLLVIARNSTCR